MRTTSVTLRSALLPGLPAELRLAATLYLPDGPDHDDRGRRSPGLVVGHGAGSRRTNHDDFCREACLQGFVVLAFDFRGHGDSGWSADGPLEQDVLAAAAFLRRRTDVDDEHICYRGSSMGGFYGLRAAVETKFTALALLCPASERVILDALQADEERPAATRWDVPRLRTYFEAQDSVALAARVRRPVLLVHARADAVVPFDHSLALAHHLAGEATLLALAGGNHTSAQHDPHIHRLTARWLLDQVTSACTGRT